MPPTRSLPLRSSVPLAVLGAVAASALLAGCGASAAPPVHDAAALEVDAGPPAEPVDARLARYLTGRFDSAAQATEDATYFEIHLASCPIDAPELGAHVLYVEQAAAGSLSRPYRQRLYVIEPGDDEATAISRVLELADAAAWVGACDREERPGARSADAMEKVGCAVSMRWSEGRFEGGTEGRDCPSTRDGAAYTTSEVTLDDAVMRSWDRGYDEGGAQVWGAVAGPYRFDRKSALPPPE